MNIGLLSDHLKDSQAALILSEENRRYFTGFTSSDGCLLVTRKGSAFLTDSRYIEDAERIITDADVFLQKQIYVQLDNLLQKFGCSEVMVEASRTSIARLNQYRRGLRDYSFNVSDRLDWAISSLREVKLPEELEKMAKAQAIAEAAFTETLAFIKPGVPERDVANELEYRMKKYGAAGVSFETIVVSGENSSKPHGVPGAKPIADGDFVTIDFGALYDGYHSDTTRTVAVGHVTPEMANVYELVRTAQQTGVDALHPGLTASDYDRAARDVIDKAGFGAYFGHSLGHGVGVEIHEQPFCGPNSQGVLQAGNVVSCEPGVYLPGRFGVRIEDMLEVTQEGCRNFCTLPKTLLVL